MALGQPDIRGISAGLHLTVTLPAGTEPTVVQQALHQHGLALWGLRQHYQTGAAVDGLVLGFSRAASNFDDSLTRLVSTLRTVNVSTGVS
jgi:DNA-binding transcriptional MocR family regulator